MQEQGIRHAKNIDFYCYEHFIFLASSSNIKEAANTEVLAQQRVEEFRPKVVGK